MNEHVRAKGWLLLAVSVYGFLFVPLYPAPGVAEDASQLLRKGIDLYHNLDYEMALDSLTQAERMGGLSEEEQIWLYRVKGFCYAALGDKVGALTCFKRLLTLDPKHKLGTRISPKIKEIFDEAVVRFKAERMQQDQSAPVLRYNLPEQPVAYGEELAIPVYVQDESEVAQAQLFYRKKGDVAYAYMPMVPQGGVLYLGMIPSEAVTREAVEFYMVVIDEVGNAVLDGNTENPHALQVAPNPLARPWYRQWWVWGVAALVVGGASAAAYLASDQGNSGAQSVPAGSIAFEF